MEITDKVAMCNYRANRFCCDAADRAMQTCGGVGYSGHMPFEHIYRHHRRYRITEGSEEIQMRKVAGKLFGYNRQSSKCSMNSAMSTRVFQSPRRQPRLGSNSFSAVQLCTWLPVTGSGAVTGNVMKR
jgi:hypothetical protein